MFLPFWLFAPAEVGGDLGPEERTALLFRARKPTCFVQRTSSRKSLLEDLCARLTGAFAMSVDVLAFGELDVDGLRVLAADGFRALVIGAPLVADHDDGIPEGHLRMAEIAGGVENDEERLAPERLPEPAIGGHRRLET